MRASLACTLLLMTGISAAHAQTPADPATAHYADWTYATLPAAGDDRLVPEVNWPGIVAEGPPLLAWVQWRHRSPTPVPGDTALFEFRVTRMRFDCEGRRYQPLATIYYQRRDPALVRVGSSDAPGEWTYADTTLMIREMMDVACIPRDLGIGDELPLGLPASRWTEILRGSTVSRQLDTAGIQHRRGYRLAWSRDVHGPLNETLRGGYGSRGDTFNTHYRLLRVDCATGRYRIVRQVLAFSDRLVDSLTRPGVLLVARPGDADYGEISAVCGGPPGAAPTSLRTPGTPGAPMLALHRGASSFRARRRGRKRGA